MPKKRSMKRKNTDQEERPQQHVEEQSTNESQHPPRKITPIINGQQREYHYRTSVKSYEELDKFRFQNQCQFTGKAGRKRHDFKSFIIPCTRKKSGKKQCDFELRAWRPDLESGKIHIYSFSQHNHPLESDVKRSLYRKDKELVPDDKPPNINQTPDNLEWTFLQTFSDYDKMSKFRHKYQCMSTSNDERNKKSSQIRYYCNRRKKHHCKFMLLAVKTDKQCYQVYKYAEHTCKEIASKLEKGSISTDPSTSFRTPDNIEWTFLKTFPDHDKMSKFRCDNTCNSRSDDENRGRIRYYCVRRFTHYHCKFMLLALKTTKQGYHVYKTGEHNHPRHKIKRKQKYARGKQKSRQKQIEDEDEEGEVPLEEEQEDEPPVGQQQQEEDNVGHGHEQDEQMETDDGKKYPLEKCQRRLLSNLRKDDMVRAKKWVSRIDQAEIGQVVAELDVENVANLLSIADIDICICETRLPFWLPWIKMAIRTRRAELVEFVEMFKELLKVESLPKKLKRKIRKMLDKRRLEMETQKMVPEETSSNNENEEETGHQDEEETGKENEEELGNIEETRQDEEEVEVPMEDEELHEEDEPIEPEQQNAEEEGSPYEESDEETLGDSEEATRREGEELEVPIPMEDEEQQDENEPIEPEQQNAEQEGSSDEESEEETLEESEEATRNEDEIRREEEEVEVPMEDEEQREEDEPIEPEQQNAEEEGSPYEESDEETLGDSEEATRREAEEEEVEPIEQLLIKGKNERVHKWMAQMDQSQIGTTIAGMDKWDLLRLVEMADQEIQDNEARFSRARVLAPLDEICHPEIIATNTGVQHAIHKIDSDGDVIEKQIKRRNVDLERVV